MLKVRQLRNRRQGGASLVELALVLFLLVLLLAAVIDFGRAFNSYIVITNASREGARYASRLAPSNPDHLSQYREGILAAAKRETEGSSVQLDDDNIAIDPDPLNGLVPSGVPITVTVSYNVPTIIADVAGVGTLPLNARTSMVVFGIGSSQ